MGVEGAGVRIFQRSGVGALDHDDDGVEGLRALARGIEAGVFQPDNPNRMARTLVAMQQVRLADWLADDMAEDRDAIVRELERQLRRCFCVRPEDRGEAA